jgi:hypothetical protein
MIGAISDGRVGGEARTESLVFVDCGWMPMWQNSVGEISGCVAAGFSGGLRPGRWSINTHRPGLQYELFIVERELVHLP